MQSVDKSLFGAGINRNFMRYAAERACIKHAHMRFCQAKEKNKAIGSMAEKPVYSFARFFESKNMRKYFYFPECKMSSGLEKYKLY